MYEQPLCVYARARVCVCEGGHPLALTSTERNRFMVEAASQKTGPRFKVSHDRLGERWIKLLVPRNIHYTTTEPFDFNTGISQTNYSKKLALFAKGPQIFYFEFQKKKLFVAFPG